MYQLSTVHKKNCCLSQTWSWHLRWVKRDWGSAGPRPLGYDWGPLGRNWWTGVEGSIATGWHSHWARCGSERKLSMRFSVRAKSLHIVGVCVCRRTHAPEPANVSDIWAGCPDIQGSTFKEARVNIAMKKTQCHIYTQHMYTHIHCSTIRLSDQS